MEMGLSVQWLQDPCQSACEILERGEILARVQGRVEFGPRALGQRSLLCRADDLSLNRVVKRREDFRPFAPVMLGSLARAEFKGRANDMTPFMTTVRTVRRPELWPAVTHIDGTARLQTASDERSIGRLLVQLQGRGRAPLLLNTSLNGRGQPIAAEETAALRFFSADDVEFMILEDLLITKSFGGSR
jgi:carbamoyltransferase